MRGRGKRKEQELEGKENRIKREREEGINVSERGSHEKNRGKKIERKDKRNVIQKRKRMRK